MLINIAWECDFCKKTGITVNEISGILYCSHCKQSYGETMDDFKDRLITKKVHDWLVKYLYSHNLGTVDDQKKMIEDFEKMMGAL